MAKYLDPRALRKLENLRLAARGVVEGFIAGLHRSPFHGFSVEFSEYRKYTPGDDLKHFDWKAYAKTDKAYIKQYEEETNLKAYLLLDVSTSMGYGSDDFEKLEYGCYLAASIAHLLVRQQDSVGLVTFHEEIDTYLGLSRRTPSCALLPIGWPTGRYGRPPRRSVDECLHWERYDEESSGT